MIGALALNIGRAIASPIARRIRHSPTVRQHISPTLTNLYATLGFANRSSLAAKIKNLATINPTPLPETLADPELTLDRLTDQGILKSAFRDEISSLAQVEEYMLSGRTHQGKFAAFDNLTGVSSLGLQFSPLFADQAAFVSKIATGIVAGTESIYAAHQSGDSKAIAYSIATAKAIGAAAGILSVAWLVGIPFLTTAFISPLGWGMGIAFGAGVVATIANDKMPSHHPLAKIARFYARCVFPYVVIGSGIHLVDLVHDAHMRIQGVLEHMGMEGTLAYSIGSLALLNHIVKTVKERIDKGYTGQLDPGEINRIRMQGSASIYSILADGHFLATFGVLVFASSFFLIPNVWAVGAGALLVPFLTPVAATGITAALRGSKKLVDPLKTPRRTKMLDHAKLYLPWEGFLAGGVLATLYSLGNHSLVPLLGYVTAYGSLATLLVTQSHGIFHSINTALGQISNLSTTATDVLGEREVRELVGDKVVYVGNPNTGLIEHSSGVVFTLLLAAKPHLRLVSFFDKTAWQKGFSNLADPSIEPDLILRTKQYIEHMDDPAAEEALVSWIVANRARINPDLNTYQAALRFVANGPALPSGGLLPNSKNMAEDLAHSEWAACLQEGVYGRLRRGVLQHRTAGGRLRNRTTLGRCQRMIDNLRATADYYDTELKTELTRRIRGMLTLDEFAGFQALPQFVWDTLVCGGYLTEVCSDMAQLQPTFTRERAVFVADAALANLSPADRDRAYDLLHQRFRHRTWFEMWNGSGTVARASIPTEQFEKVKDLFDNPDSETLKFKPTIREENIDKCQTTDEVKDILQQVLRGWFIEEINEYVRAGMDALAERAQSFRSLADTMEARLTHLTAAERQDRAVRRAVYEECYEDWAWELGCFDPIEARQQLVCRKETAGDEQKVRKVENVTTVNIFQGLRVYKMWSTDPFDSDPAHTATHWISGTWARVLNQDFRYDAPAGTPESIQFVWIEADEVLNEIQKNRSESLSTSPVVERFDNKPDTPEGFLPGAVPIRVSINGEERFVSNYYHNPANQGAVPSVRRDPSGAASCVFRDSSHTQLPAKFQVATIDKVPWGSMEPATFEIPNWDYAVMMDKNDIQLSTYLHLPAIVERDRQNNTYLNLLYMHRVGKDFTIPDPYPDPRLTLDKEVGLHVVDANIEFSYHDHHIDRTALSGFGEEQATIIWDALVQAGYIDANGLIQPKFDTKKKEFSLPTLTEPQNTTIQQVLQRAVQDSSERQIPLLVCKAAVLGGRDEGVPKGPNDEPGFARLHGAKVSMAAGEITAFSLLYGTGAGQREVILPTHHWPRYIDSLNVPADVTDLEIGGDVFAVNPHREGDAHFVKITYRDRDEPEPEPEQEQEQIGFARLFPGDRPQLWNKRT
ncbi:MAG: hypothetical protein HQ596_00505 [Candidatus Saganbacteria bacterium]|nr:hypothetical protein [Candidatus Saganbacteria bacterium]